MGSNLRPLVILCIDDQTSLLLARTLVLQNEGYSVLAASSAAEGLRKFRETQVDLVMSDHLLGGTTGAEIAAQMKREKPEIPIIILSGVSEIPEGAQHVDLFLSKLEGPVVMLQEISKLLKCRNATAAGK